MAAEAVLQGPILRYPPRPSVYRAGQQRKKDSAASKRCDAFAFLSQTIEDIPLFDSEMAKTDRKVMYDNLIYSCKRLFKITGDGFKIKDDRSMDNLIDILEGMERWATNHKMTFTAVRNGDDEITFVLYRTICCLEDYCYTFLLCPAESLPEKTSELYKRFIKFISYSMDVRVDGKFSDNGYVQMIFDCDDEEYQENGELSRLYKSDRVQSLYKEISEKDINGLLEDLTAHRKECKPEHLRLVDLMMEGMEILPSMSLSNYWFDPFEDGFDTESHLMLIDTIAFTYSDKDGLSENIVSWVNNDIRCGLCPQGWNRACVLSDITKDEYDYLVSEETMEKRFLDWNYDFYQESLKFDNFKWEDVKDEDE